MIRASGSGEGRGSQDASSSSPPTRASSYPQTRASPDTNASTNANASGSGSGTAVVESSFGLGGRLVPDAEDDSIFWVDIEGKQFMFQLSLCGPLSASIADADGDGVGAGGRKDVPSDGTEIGEVDEVGDAAKFEDGKITFERFASNASLLDRDDLVIRWGVT